MAHFAKETKFISIVREGSPAGTRGRRGGWGASVPASSDRGQASGQRPA